MVSGIISEQKDELSLELAVTARARKEKGKTRPSEPRASASPI
jgi:hypothetical protein